MRPDESADMLVFFGGLLVAAGWFMTRSAVRQFRRPAETIEELRRNLDARGIPRFAQRLPPGDPRPWVPFIKWGGAESVVVGAIVAVIGLLLLITGLYQIAKWRL
jgi:hypothetical protein